MTYLTFCGMSVAPDEHAAVRGIMSQGAATLNDVAYWVDSRAEAQEAGFPKLWDIARAGKVDTTAVLQMLSSTVRQASASGSNDAWCPTGNTVRAQCVLPPHA